MIFCLMDAQAICPDGTTGLREFDSNLLPLFSSTTSPSIILYLLSHPTKSLSPYPLPPISTSISYPALCLLSLLPTNSYLPLPLSLTLSSTPCSIAISPAPTSTPYPLPHTPILLSILYSYTLPSSPDQLSLSSRILLPLPLISYSHPYYSYLLPAPEAPGDQDKFSSPGACRMP